MPQLLVVGAGPGISAATARRFGQQGYDVALVARRTEALTELSRTLEAEGVVARCATADAADAAGLTAAIGEATAAGPVDVLLYNVSVGRQADLASLAPEDLVADLAAGVVGLQVAVRAVLPGMRERGAGTVLVTGGGSADQPFPALPTLGVQKAAVRALAQTQAKALAPEGIHVATVTVRGFVGPGKQIEPARVADLYAELVAETAGPAEQWRTVVDLTP
jgi:NADP-dependent 3-hydroxy acid dehydrogenase YdfG